MITEHYNPLNVGSFQPVSKRNISDDLNLQQYYYLIFDKSLYLNMPTLSKDYQQ